MIYTGHIYIGPEGPLHIPVPPELRNRLVSFSIEIHPCEPNESDPGFLTKGPPATIVAPIPAPVITTASTQDHFNRFFGSLPDFPDVERPGTDSFEPRETMD